MSTTLAKRYDLRLTRLHSHVGSGTDPEVWKRCTRMTLDLAARLPDVRTVNLGGGFKVGRMPGEPSVDMADVGAHVQAELQAFRERDGRALHLEIEPGTYLVANAGTIVATCVDVVDTGRAGYLLRQARHRHARGDAALALRRPASDRRPRRRPGRGRRRLRGAVLRVGGHPHPRSRRSRGAGPAPGAPRPAPATW